MTRARVNPSGVRWHSTYSTPRRTFATGGDPFQSGARARDPPAHPKAWHEDIGNSHPRATLLGPSCPLAEARTSLALTGGSACCRNITQELGMWLARAQSIATVLGASSRTADGMCQNSAQASELEVSFWGHPRASARANPICQCFGTRGRASIFFSLRNA